MEKEAAPKPAHIKLLGTSHIAHESLEQIAKQFKEDPPDIVAVELDKKRLHALLSEQKSGFSWYAIRRVGFKGFLFALLGSWGSKKLGKLIGATPGQEMLKAVKLARENKANVALIDRDIEVTLRRFSKVLTWREKWKFVKEFFRAIFRRKEVEKEMGISVVNFDLRKVPSQKVIQSLTSKMKKDYPSIYHVLLEERNEYMAKNLIHLAHLNPGKKILVVVGAGHIEGMVSILRKGIVKKQNKSDK